MMRHREPLMCNVPNVAPAIRWEVARKASRACGAAATGIATGVLLRAPSKLNENGVGSYNPTFVIARPEPVRCCTSAPR